MIRSECILNNGGALKKELKHKARGWPVINLDLNEYKMEIRYYFYVTLVTSAYNISAIRNLIIHERRNKLFPPRIRLREK